MLCPTCGAKNNNTDVTVIADAAAPAGREICRPAPIYFDGKPERKMKNHNFKDEKTQKKHDFIGECVA